MMIKLPRLRFNHPYPLILYLEWILLGVAFLTALVPTSLALVSHPGSLHRPFRHLGVFGDGLLGIVICGMLVWGLPLRRSPSQKIGFTFLGFGLSWWVAAMSGPRASIPFAALLLVVVMRACLLFQWTGRIVVAIAAFTSFMVRLSLMMAWLQRRFALGGRIPRPLRRLPEEDLQSVLLGLGIGSGLLFGLVLVFVLLMVGTLVTEHRSREKLAMVNRRLRRYSLMIEDQAALQERNRIAREIHDSLGHSLTAQSIHLENVSVWYERDPHKAQTHLQTARTLGKDALQNIRQAVATLRQQPLKGKSLSEALQDLISEFEHTLKITVKTKIIIAEPLPSEIAIALYRLIQESLTNIAKHAQASTVWVELTENSVNLALKIQDDGQGFDVATNRRGFGLTSMRERTEALSGKFEIQSQPDAGCQLSILIPR